MKQDAMPMPENQYTCNLNNNEKYDDDDDDDDDVVVEGHDVGDETRSHADT